ncbi:hypothetical protein [Flavisolibacter tropicus]|uniref:hypothetical protein n=1 Tax=Flavisolibacter tropicus TaxID=1492898 RepID=UPI001314169B|nr:hypothetical protein [Flavisolibacter tropicus]
MANADRFGETSKIVMSICYHHLSSEVRRQGLFGKLMGKVNFWLREENREEKKEALKTH